MIDELDQKLIELLMNNSKQSSRELADQLGIDGSTVRRRVKKLVADGAVLYSVLPNPDVLGYSIRAIVALNVDPRKINKVIKALVDKKEIKMLYPTSGRFDIMLFVWFQSVQAIFDFVKDTIGIIDGVKNAETFICLSNEYDYLPR